MKTPDAEQGFWLGLASKRALGNLVRGAGIATLFGAAMLSLELGSYPTYNVLEIVPEGLACRLASVAHHDYLHSATWLIYGTALAMIACLMGDYENRSRQIARYGTKPLRQQIAHVVWLGLSAYLPLMLAVALYFMAVVHMADFIGHGAQPALMRLAHPTDGYVCPPVHGAASQD